MGKVCKHPCRSVAPPGRSSPSWSHPVLRLSLSRQTDLGTVPFDLCVLFTLLKCVEISPIVRQLFSSSSSSTGERTSPAPPAVWSVTGSDSVRVMNLLNTEATWARCVSCVVPSPTSSEGSDPDLGTRAAKKDEINHRIPTSPNIHCHNEPVRRSHRTWRGQSSHGSTATFSGVTLKKNSHTTSLLWKPPPKHSLSVFTVKQHDDILCRSRFKSRIVPKREDSRVDRREAHVQWTQSNGVVCFIFPHYFHTLVVLLDQIWR